MTIESLNVALRTDVGTHNMRRMRLRDALMPAVIYGGKEKSVSISLEHKTLAKALEDPSFHTRLITLHIGKAKEQVILKSIQRHPAKNLLLHADFLRVSADHKINLRVPLHFINEDQCAGIKIDGGMLIRAVNDVEVACLPGNIPEYIEVNVEEMRLGDQRHLSEVVWPKGVESVALSYGNEHDLSVASIVVQRTADEIEASLQTAEELAAAAAAAEAEATEEEAAEKGDADKDADKDANKDTNKDADSS